MLEVDVRAHLDQVIHTITKTKVQCVYSRQNINLAAFIAVPYQMFEIEQKLVLLYILTERINVLLKFDTLTMFSVSVFVLRYVSSQVFSSSFFSKSDICFHQLNSQVNFHYILTHLILPFDK